MNTKKPEKEGNLQTLAASAMGSTRKFSGYLELLGLELGEHPESVLKLPKETAEILITVNRKLLNSATAIALFQERVEMAKKQVRQRHIKGANSHEPGKN